ncbi:MAG: porin [Burkholderiaceae bacterium]|nr:porin [Burkholderiaceae bacterium]
MKQFKLIPLLAAIACPLYAGAQSSVTLYGIVDLAVASENHGSGNVTSLTNIGVPSRLGVRGTEDLGGGLQATFNLEGALNPDTGTGLAAGGGLNFQRISTVGLKGSFGEVKLGRDYTPAFMAIREHDALTYFYYNNMATYTVGAGGATTRYSNGIFYVSPQISGLTVRAAYAMGEKAAGNNNIGNAFGLAAIYNVGKLTLDAFHQVDQVNTGTATAAVAGSKKMSGLGGRYDFGVARVYAGYGRNSTETVYGKNTALNLGVSVPVGNGEVLAQIIRLEQDVQAGVDPKATGWGVTYRHFLSKRSTVYATAGQMRNNDSGRFSLLSAQVNPTPAAGKDPRGLAVGITHSF